MGTLPRIPGHPGTDPPSLVVDISEAPPHISFERRKTYDSEGKELYEFVDHRADLWLIEQAEAQGHVSFLLNTLSANHEEVMMGSRREDIIECAWAAEQALKRIFDAKYGPNRMRQERW